MKSFYTFTTQEKVSGRRLLTVIALSAKRLSITIRIQLAETHITLIFINHSILF